MPIASMTGFARAQGQAESCTWTWEARSVNARGLDVRCRLPTGFEDLDGSVRERVGKRFRRGNVTVALSMDFRRGQSGVRVNTAALDEILALVPSIRERMPDAPPPTVEGVLGLRGVIEAAEDDLAEDAREALAAEMMSGLNRALDSLASMRMDEGGRLLAVLTERLDRIAALCAEAESLAATQPEALRARLVEQLAALADATPPVAEDRLAQEVALLAAKADLREELDRLNAHVAAARALLGEDAAVGRKLDFLCQEFNREANTLCSKSADVALTRVGLDLKATIEQLREQVQNIE